MIINKSLKAIFDGAKLDETERIYIYNILYDPDFNGEYFMESSAYEKLFSYYSDEMPYGTQKARTGDPDEWILNKLYRTIV